MSPPPLLRLPRRALRCRRHSGLLRHRAAHAGRPCEVGGGRTCVCLGAPPGVYMGRGPAAPTSVVNPSGRFGRVRVAGDWRAAAAAVKRSAQAVDPEAVAAVTRLQQHDPWFARRVERLPLAYAPAVLRLTAPRPLSRVRVRLGRLAARPGRPRRLRRSRARGPGRSSADPDPPPLAAIPPAQFWRDVEAWERGAA